MTEFGNFWVFMCLHKMVLNGNYHNLCHLRPMPRLCAMLYILSTYQVRLPCHRCGSHMKQLYMIYNCFMCETQ